MQEKREINPAKAYMWGYRSIVLRIESLRRERDRVEHINDRLENAYDRATRATSRMTATRVSGTGSHDGMANAVMDIIRYKEEAKGADVGVLTARINREIDAAADALTMRLTLIGRLSDERYKTVMVMRYVEGMAWDEIAAGMHYDRVTIWRFHGEALKEILRLM